MYLRNYVQHFGIENFYKQTELLWRLGQLEESYGNINEAKGIYRLVIHNNLNNVTKIRNYYDTLITNDKTNYVPLEKYYKMVDARKNVDSLRPPRNVYTNMGKSINNKQHSDYGPSINIETGELIFTSKRNVDPLGVVNEDIYHSTYEGGMWSVAEPIGLPINSGNNDGSPCLSNDGKYLYFASDRKGGRGGLDLYKAQFKNGKFSKPRNLGKKYNTFGNEMFPYIHKDGSIFLASDGHIGYGGLDMFKIVANKETGKPEGSPINMGKSVNTTYDDFGIVYTKKFEGYLSSNREGGMGSDDIYSFTEEIIPFYFLDLEVTGVENGTKAGLDHAGITFNEDEVEVETNFTNEKGHYKHQLHKDGHYEIKVEKDSFYTRSLVFNLDKAEIEKNEKNDDGDYIIKEAAMAKLVATQLSDKVCYECMRIFGGYGYMEEYPMARLLRDAQLGTIGGGTSEVLCEIISKMIIDTKQYKAAIKH